MKRQEVLDLYKKYVQRFYRLITVKNSTYSDQLEYLGKKMFPDKFTGVYSIDTIPKDLPVGSYFITNTAHSKENGVHWIACVVGKNKTLFIYDTFGRKTKNLVPTAYDKAKKNGWKIVDSHYSNEQGGVATRSCGLRSLSFLSVARDIGIKNAIKI